MLSLSPGEQVITSGGAKYHGTKGTLFLTNKKLTFTYEKRGIIFKGKYTPISLLLTQISQVAVIGAGPFKKISVNITKNSASSGIPRHEFKVRDPYAWKTRIEQACGEAATGNVSASKIVAARKCQSCDNLVEPHLAKCPVCGAQLL